MENKEQNARIGIIGAGVSGLRCASVLLESGFNVTILEARDRIGGRICQSNGLGYTVDIGPNWIHARNGDDKPHPIFKLATETKTLIHHWSRIERAFDEEGNQMSPELVDRLSTTLWEIIEEAFVLSGQGRKAPGGSTIAANTSLHDFITERAIVTLEDESERRFLLQMSEMFGAFVGESVWKQSLRFAWMEECCGGEELFIPSDYSAILEKISEPVLVGTTIRLNEFVESIDTAANSLKKRIEVRTRSGKIYCFDEVVVTCPLGWLKKNLDVFKPPLPQGLTWAVSHLGLSQLEKVFITFPEAFWSSKGNFASDPCYTSWLSPSYAPDTNPERWPQEIWDLSLLEPPHNHPTILFYIFGDCARHVVSSIYGKTPEQRQSFLDNLFRPYYSKLPGYDVDGAECKPSAILATEWYTDDLAGNASYCNFQVGIEAADEDVLALRRGCPDRGLWFCGEHAAPFEECGTVAGAYLSGEHAAQGISQKWIGKS